MRPFRVAVPAHVAETIRELHPELRRKVRAALEAIAADPSLGAPLKDELQGLRRYRVRRHRIVFGVDTTTRMVRVMAVGPRDTIYEEIAKHRRERRREGS